MNIITNKIINRLTYFIAGPTASGKSGFAISLAKEKIRDGFEPIIINSDALQCYMNLPLLLAVPSFEEKQICKHVLYEYLPAFETSSVNDWLSNVSKVFSSHNNKNQIFIFVGGSGLYLHCLEKGISDIPLISAVTKEEAQKQIKEESLADIWQKLCEIDIAHEKINKNDPQRINRALEVYLESGASIFSYYKSKNIPFTFNNCEKIVILPDRKKNYQNVEARFDQMIKLGAVEEVKKFNEKYPDINGSIKKALGYCEINAYLNGEISLENAIEKAKKNTRNYVKRQNTWINKHFSHWRYITGDI